MQKYPTYLFDSSWFGYDKLTEFYFIYNALFCETQIELFEKTHHTFELN